jgi:hypothetical protein
MFRDLLTERKGAPLPSLARSAMATVFALTAAACATGPAPRTADSPPCPEAHDPLERLLDPVDDGAPQPCLVEVDEDGDGRYERWLRHRRDDDGLPVRTEIGEGDQIQSITERSYEDGRLVVVAYDIDADGTVDRRERLVRDERGHLEHRDIDEDADGSPELQIEYTFDRACLLRQHAVRALERDIVLRGARYTHDDGRLEEVVADAGGRVVSRVTVARTDDAGRPTLVRYDHRGDGTVERESLLRYDADGRLAVTVERDGEGRALHRRRNLWGADGRLRAVVIEEVDGGRVVATRRFRYDCDGDVPDEGGEADETSPAR